MDSSIDRAAQQPELLLPGATLPAGASNVLASRSNTTGSQRNLPVTIMVSPTHSRGDLPHASSGSGSFRNLGGAGLSSISRSSSNDADSADISKERARTSATQQRAATQQLQELHEFKHDMMTKSAEEELAVEHSQDQEPGLGQRNRRSSLSRMIEASSRSLSRARSKPENAFAKLPASTSSPPQRVRRPSVNWIKLRSATRTTMAINRDLRDMRTLVGSVDGDARTTSEREEQMREADMRRRERRIILPNSRTRTIWDSLQILFVVYVALVLPFRLGFSVVPEVGSVGWWLELIVDLYFMVDIVLNFRFFAYEDHDRSVIDDPRKIRRHYLRSWFIVDLVSVLPISYIMQIMAKPNQNGGYSKLFKVLRVVRIAKLLRLLRFKRLQEENVLMKRFNASSKLIRAIFTALATTHFYACIWFGFSNERDGWAARAFPISGYCSTEDRESLACFDSATPQVKYLYSFWFCASLFLASEMFLSIVPRTHGEVILTIVGQTMAAILFGYILGAVGQMIAAKHPLQEKVDVKLAELREFLTDKRIPKQLKTDIREYMHELYEKKIYDVREVTAQLPPGLAHQLFDAMYSDTLMRVPLFKDLTQAALRQICLVMKPYTARRGEYIYREGEISRGMYVVETGLVQISQYNMVVSVVHPNSFFGDGSLVHGGEYRDTSAMAREASQLAFLTSEDCDEISKEHPEMMVRFQEVDARKKALLAGRM